jgi:S-formylglutathione hydrolase FrmB
MARRLRVDASRYRIVYASVSVDGTGATVVAKRNPDRVSLVMVPDSVSGNIRVRPGEWLPTQGWLIGPSTPVTLTYRDLGPVVQEEWRGRVDFGSGLLAVIEVLLERD